MPRLAKTISVDELTRDVVRLLDRADDHPLILTRNGHRYRLFRQDEAISEDLEARRAILQSLLDSSPTRKPPK